MEQKISPSLLHRYAETFWRTLPFKEGEMINQQLQDLHQKLCSLWACSWKKALPTKRLQKQCAERLVRIKNLHPGAKTLLDFWASCGVLHTLEHWLNAFKKTHPQRYSSSAVVLTFAHPPQKKDLDQFHEHVDVRYHQRILGGYLIEKDGKLMDRSLQTYLRQLEEHWRER